MKIIRVETSNGIWGERVIIEGEMLDPYTRPVYRISLSRNKDNAAEVEVAKTLKIGEIIVLTNFPSAKLM